MLSKTREKPARSPAANVTRDTITGPGGSGEHPGSNGAPVAREADLAATGSTTTKGSNSQTAAGGETRTGRFRRKAHRTRLHGYAIAAVALVAYLIALAATNTAHVKVNWVFGSSHVSLVWLVLFTAILGWMLGLATSATFHWRTRAPRRGGEKS